MTRISDGVFAASRSFMKSNWVQGTQIEFARLSDRVSRADARDTETTRVAPQVGRRMQTRNEVVKAMRGSSDEIDRAAA
jgi:hypothetical protein